MTIKEFITRAFSENDEPSSKRIVGGIIALTVVLAWFVNVLMYGLTDNAKDLGETLVWGGCMLLGITTIGNAISNSKRGPE